MARSVLMAVALLAACLVSASGRKAYHRGKRVSEPVAGCRKATTQAECCDAEKFHPAGQKGKACKWWRHTKSAHSSEINGPEVYEYCENPDFDGDETTLKINHEKQLFNLCEPPTEDQVGGEEKVEGKKTARCGHVMGRNANTKHKAGEKEGKLVFVDENGAFFKDPEAEHDFFRSKCCAVASSKVEGKNCVFTKSGFCVNPTEGGQTEAETNDTCQETASAQPQEKESAADDK